jgi:hypothetical protein
LAGAYAEADVRDEGNGRRRSVACFVAAGAGKCDLAAVVNHDAFKRSYTFTPLQTFLATGGTGLSSRIELAEGGAPRLMLEVFYSEGTWLFMDRVSVLAGGTLALDRPLPAGQVRRLVLNAYQLLEGAAFEASPEEIESLRKIGSGSVMGRLSGQRGAHPIPDQAITLFRDDLQISLRIRDHLVARLPKQ